MQGKHSLNPASSFEKFPLLSVYTVIRRQTCSTRHCLVDIA